jgi:Uma2 family endonuclease
MSAATQVITNLKVEHIPDRVVYIAEHPLTIEEFYELFGEDDNVELIDGVVIPKMAAQDPHEDLFRFLFIFLALYIEEHGLGMVRGSRTFVPITPYKGRLPDILFVRKEREDIVGQKGLTSAPDLAIEIISPGDTEMDIMQLQSDYEQIGTKEFWIIDQPRKQVRAFLLDKVKNVFVPIKLDENILRSEVVTGFWLESNWLWQRPLPPVSDVLKKVGVL